VLAQCLQHLGLGQTLRPQMIGYELTLMYQ
jgi:hypothetical protein